jgi:hypothetical protein
MITVKSKIRTVRQGDPKFMLSDGLVISPRAGFEISKSCPSEYKSIIITAVNAGWIKPVANMFDTELTMEYLRSSND